MLIRILGKDRMLLVVPPEGFLLGEELASWGGEGKGERINVTIMIRIDSLCGGGMDGTDSNGNSCKNQG